MWCYNVMQFFYSPINLKKCVKNTKKILSFYSMEITKGQNISNSNNYKCKQQESCFIKFHITTGYKNEEIWREIYYITLIEILK